MAAKKLVLVLCAVGFLQTSFAGFDRFWIFSKDTDAKSDAGWESLSDDEQRALIKRYQTLKETPEVQNVALQQRMDWFNQLPEQEKQKMRETWQQMSSAERNEMRKKIQQATTNAQRTEIREHYLQKYVQNTVVAN